jgi:hypothetical protein
VPTIFIRTDTPQQYSLSGLAGSVSSTWTLVGDIPSSCGNPIGVPCGGTNASTPQTANLNITGVTQTGTLGTSSQVSIFPGAVNAAQSNGTFNTAQFTAGSSTGGLAEAYAACLAGGSTTCDIQISSDITISSTQTITLTHAFVVTHFHGAHLLHCTNPTGKCLIFSGPYSGYAPLVIDGLTIDGTSSGGSGIELVGMEVPQANLVISNFDATGILAYAHYVSGGSVTGSVNQNCTVTTFNNGSTATATIALSGTNTLSQFTVLNITSQGTGATAAPTTAVLGNGTATCSGTIQIYSTIGALAFEANDVEDATNGAGISLVLLQNEQGALFDNASNNLEVKINVQAGHSAHGVALDTENSQGIAYRGLIQSWPGTRTEVLGNASQTEHDNLWYEGDGDGTSGETLVFFSLVAGVYDVQVEFNNCTINGLVPGAVFGVTSGYAANVDIFSTNNVYRNYSAFMNSAFSGTQQITGFNDYLFVSGALAYYYSVVNGATVPASKTVIGTNGSGQIIDASSATLANNTTGSAAKWTTARNLAGNSVDGSANVAFSNAFIVQGTADSGLSGAQFMGALGTGLVKNTATTGVQSIAVANTDYVAPSAWASWTPTDASGAGLAASWTVVSAQCLPMPAFHLERCYAQITYPNPTTSSATAAIGGLPVAIKTGYQQFYPVNYIGGPAVANVDSPASTTSFTIATPSLTSNVLNSTFSNANLWFDITYPTN